MTISLKKAAPVEGFLHHRINRMIEANRVGVADALLFGVVGALGLIPDVNGGDGGGPNQPMYENEPSTWCGRCKAQYWSARCPLCGR